MDINFLLTGQRIREARHMRNLTAEVLAEKVGLATESLRHIECASSKPSLQTLYKIASVLDVSLDYITGRSPSLSDSVSANYKANYGLSDHQENILREFIEGLIPIITKHV